MPAVYPRAPDAAPEAPPFDEAACATALIALREARPKITRQLAAGKVIHAAGGRVADVYRTWDDVEAERAAWAAVHPADHATVTKFKAALVGKHLDATTWYNALKTKHEVSTYAELVAATSPAAVLP